MAPGDLDEGGPCGRCGGPALEDQDFVSQVSPPAITEFGDASEGGPLERDRRSGTQVEHRPGDAPPRRARPRLPLHGDRVGRPERRRRRDHPLAGPGRPCAPRDTGRPRPGGHRRRPAAPRHLPRAPDRRSGGRGDTRRLRFGHHGANHPVQDVDLGLVQVTAQNHEVQVVGESLPRRVASG